MREKSTWRKCKWPFDPDYAKKTTCYSLKISRGKIYLRDEPNRSYPFTVSCGPDSERSYSGCFYGLPVHSLHAAMLDLTLRNEQGKFECDTVEKVKFDEAEIGYDID